MSKPVRVMWVCVVVAWWFVPGCAHRGGDAGQSHTPQGGQTGAWSTQAEDESASVAPPRPTVDAVMAMIEAGDAQGVAAALDAGVDVNAVDQHGKALLIESIHEREEDIAALLLERGADPDTRTSPRADAQSAAHVATMAGMTATLRALASRGAVLDAPSAAAAGDAYRLGALLDAEPGLMRKSWYFHPNSGERTLLGLASLHGAVPTIRLLIERGANPREPQGDDFTPLHMAAGWGHVDAVRELLEHDPRVNRATAWGWTPTNTAAGAGHDTVFGLLLERGGDYSLHCAAMRGDADRIKVLLAAGDVDPEAQLGGNTPLMAAAARGRLDAAQVLISAGARLDTANDYEGSALARAAWAGHADMVRLLLDSGCDPDVGDPEDPYGRALHRAAWQGRLEIMALLLDAGADTESVDNTEETPLFFAVKKSGYEAAKLLLERGANANARSEGGSTPLYAAVWEGDMAMAELLLEHGADLNTPTRHDGSPLHRAAQVGHAGMVRLFLRSPIDMGILDVDQKTPLHFAVEPKRDPQRQAQAYEVFDLLLAHGYSLEARSRAGYTVLHRAVHHGATPEMIAHVLNAGALLEADTAEGFTALHLACFARNPASVRVLLEHGASVNVRDKEGRMPLHIVVGDSSERAQQIVAMLGDEGVEVDVYAAAQLGELDRVRVLLRGDPTKLNAPGAGGRTLLQIAASRGDLTMVEFLLDHDPPAEVDSTGPGHHGWSALHSAAAAGHAQVVARLLAAGADPAQTGRYRQPMLFSACAKGDPEVIRLLIDAGADVNAPTAYTYTPLMQAAEYGHTVVIRMLLDAGAQVNARTKSGETALSEAVTHGRLEAAALLVEAGADVKLAGGDYSPVLHDAAAGGTPEMVRLLLEAGAEVNRLNERGDTALDWADGNDNREVAEVLKSAGGRLGHEVRRAAEQAEPEDGP